MLKLRTILLYDILYITLAIIVLIGAIIITNVEVRKSKYTGHESQITGYINCINYDGNKVTIDLISKEEIIGTYYLKSKYEKQIISNLYHLGDSIKLNGEMIKPTNNTVFNLFNYKKYLAYNNMFYLFSIDKIEKIHNNNRFSYTIKQYLIEYINRFKHSSKYLLAFILGDLSGIKKDVSNSYQIIGITHLLAVSGMQVSFIAIAILSLLKRLKWSEMWQYIVVISIILFYMFLTNYTPSIMRASVFFILLAINKIYYFNIKTINIFLLTFIIVIMMNPYFIYDIGFQFSFIISFYLIGFQTLIVQYQSNLTKLFIISYISFLSSLPIVINNFFQINVISIPVNMIFVPYFTVILFPLSLITLILPFFDGILAFLIKIMEVISINLANIKIFNIILGKPSFIILIVYFGLITYVLHMLRKGKKHYFIYIIMLVFINYINTYFNYTSLTMIDVRQGDSVLIRLSNNQGNILIDTGGKLQYKSAKWEQRVKTYSIAENTLIPYFKSIGMHTLDYLILTHGDDDHMGEAINLIEHYKVKKVLFNSGFKTQLETELMKKLKNNHIVYSYVKANASLQISKQKLYFLNPAKDESNTNDNSVVIYTKIKQMKVLLTGDISFNIEKRLINEYNLQQMDILKVTHHGSISGSSKMFLDEVRPKYALISVGLHNQFNHPSKEVINRLKKLHSKIYLTSLNGSINFEFHNKSVTIHTAKP